MYVEIKNDGSIYAINHVVTGTALSFDMRQMNDIFNYRQKLNYCNVRIMAFDTSGQKKEADAIVLPGCDIMLITKKGRRHKTYKYRVNTETEVMSFCNEAAYILALDEAGI